MVLPASAPGCKPLHVRFPILHCCSFTCLHLQCISSFNVNFLLRTNHAVNLPMFLFQCPLLRLLASCIVRTHPPTPPCLQTPAGASTAPKPRRCSIANSFPAMVSTIRSLAIVWASPWERATIAAWHAYVFISDRTGTRRDRRRIPTRSCVRILLGRLFGKRLDSFGRPWLFSPGRDLLGAFPCLHPILRRVLQSGPPLVHR
mmetsp:Transcript_5588/g.34678  ORF Transcript_5588/g.34678 Transcript_5588/m.34678 type:complete len:202 (-) Transcript_5588:867-1472(-)